METPQVTKELKQVFDDIRNLCMQFQHEYILPEHLLYVLLNCKSIKDLFKHFGLNPTRIKSELLKYLNKEIETSNKKEQIESVAFTRIVYRVFLYATLASKKYVDVEDVLISIFFEGDDCFARYLLLKNIHNKVTVDEIVDFVEEKRQKKIKEKRGVSHSTKKYKYLEEFSINLTEKAKKGKLDNIIGRDAELERIIQILNRRKKNNVIILGESGVGKTALVEGLALKIVNSEVPMELENYEIYALDMGKLIAGTRFRGDFEERLELIVKELQRSNKIILFIDEIHTLIGAGSGGNSALDASNILKPILTDNKIKCIGATTYNEYKNVFSKDKALVRRFQRLEIKEPNITECVQILKGLIHYYEKFYKIKYTDEAIEQAVVLSLKYIKDRFLPDKAIDVIDEVGARNILRKKRKRKIDTNEIKEVIAKMANIPINKINASEKKTLKDLNQQIKKVLFGQDEAVDKVVNAIKLNRSGIELNENKPIGSFLFIGPSGTGKTELAKQLAKQMDIPLIRFDMSEYSEEYAVSKLIGSAPGYVGFEQGGLLTEAILKNPYSVLLLDEIEKAHSKIYNLLLQIMDYATISDNNGRKVDFQNVIIIMTSNLGVTESYKQNIGFIQQSKMEQKNKEIVNKYFTPEFRNRLDDIIYFNALNEKVANLIVSKFIKELSNNLHSKNIKLNITSEAINWFLHYGIDTKMGARPLKRLIKKEIQEKIIDEILYGKLEKGGKISVGVCKNKIKIEIL